MPKAQHIPIGRPRSDPGRSSDSREHPGGARSASARATADATGLFHTYCRRSKRGRALSAPSCAIGEPAFAAGRRAGVCRCVSAAPARRARRVDTSRLEISRHESEDAPPVLAGTGFEHRARSAGCGTMSSVFRLRTTSKQCRNVPVRHPRVVSAQTNSFPPLMRRG